MKEALPEISKMKEGADQNTMNCYQGTFVYDGEGLEGCQRNKE